MSQRITIKNIDKHIKWDGECDLIEETGYYRITFVWDCENEKLNDTADTEFRYSFGDKKKNLMWIEELKRIADWKKGEYIYAFTKTNGDGYYNVFFRKDKPVETIKSYDIIIERSGYVCMSAFNQYSFDEDEDIKWGRNFVRVESVYNDKISKIK